MVSPPIKGQQNNHNNCFIEAHGQELDEQRNHNNNVVAKETQRLAMIKQLINKNKIITEDIYDGNRRSNQPIK